MRIVKIVAILSFFIPFGLGAIFYLCFYKNKSKDDIKKALISMFLGFLFLSIFLVMLFGGLKKGFPVVVALLTISWLISYAYGSKWSKELIKAE